MGEEQDERDETDEKKRRKKPTTDIHPVKPSRDKSKRSGAFAKRYSQWIFRSRRSAIRGSGWLIVCAKPVYMLVDTRATGNSWVFPVRQEK